MYTIGDFLIQTKNAYMANKKQFTYPRSNVILEIAKILKKEGYLKDFKSEKKPENGQGEITLELMYKGKVPAISGVKLISKPSVREYINKTHLRKSVRYGIGIVSTSHGMMTNKQAEKEGVGGELICQIY